MSDADHGNIQEQEEGPDTTRPGSESDHSDGGSGSREGCFEFLRVLVYRGSYHGRDKGNALEQCARNAGAVDWRLRRDFVGELDCLYSGARQVDVPRGSATESLGDPWERLHRMARIFAAWDKALDTMRVVQEYDDGIPNLERKGQHGVDGETREEAGSAKEEDQAKETDRQRRHREALESQWWSPKKKEGGGD